MSAEYHAGLVCHPSNRSEAVHAIQVIVRRSVNAELQINFRLEGDIARIRIPPPSVARSAAELWEHTCFEAFIAVEGQSAYHEFNFTPSGEWAVYAFSGYRKDKTVANDTIPPRIDMRPTGNGLELDTVVRLDGLSEIHPGASLRLGLSAVIEASDGLSYWALCHPASKPDFHNADGFTLLADPPGAER